MADMIESVVTKILSEILLDQGIAIEPSRDISLIDSGLLDSITIVTFVGQLEVAFGVTFSMSDITLAGC